MKISNTSSIGAAWPPEFTTHERLRGFYPEVIASVEDAGVLVEEISHAQLSAQAHETTTRLSIRAVAEASMVPVISAAGVQIEGALPVASQPGRFIVYTAWNDQSRRMTPDKLADHQKTILEARNREVVTADPQTELASKGFEMQILDGQHDEAMRRSYVGRFLGLYGMFGFSAADVEELLVNPNNTVAFIANESGEILSTVLAESATIGLRGGQPLHIAEITEATTARKAQGKGLYTALSRALTRYVLLQQSVSASRLDVLYGESNLSSKGVIHAAYRNGRRFSGDDAVLLGLVNQPGFGILEQNFKVNDGAETRQYNDFAITYIPQSNGNGNGHI